MSTEKLYSLEGVWGGGGGGGGEGGGRGGGGRGEGEEGHVGTMVTGNLLYSIVYYVESVKGHDLSYLLGGSTALGYKNSHAHLMVHKSV